MIMMKWLAMYLLSYHQQSNESQQTNEQTKVIQEVVSPEVSKLYYTLLNKKQGDQIQFFPEKKLEKRKWIHHYCQINIPLDGLCYKKGYIIDPSILQKFFSSVSKCLSCN